MKYIVEQYQLCVQKYTIEADSAESAMQKVMNGEGDECGGAEYLEVYEEMGIADYPSIRGVFVSDTP
jgi:hypothetical protein